MGNPQNPDLLRLQRKRYKTKRRERDRDWYRIHSLGEHIPDAFSCEICGDPEVGRKHAKDHDHTTGIKRGMLCHSCNPGLGLFRDRPDLLRKAAEYIDRYQQRNDDIRDQADAQHRGNS
jgi:hypothetical protein